MMNQLPFNLQHYLDYFKTWSVETKDKKHFFNQNHKRFGLKAIFDADIVKLMNALIDETPRGEDLQECFDRMEKILNFTKFLKECKFIFPSHCDQICSRILERRNNEDLKLVEILKYLSNSKSKQELIEDWKDKSPGKDYLTFWRQTADDSNVFSLKIRGALFDCFLRFDLLKELDATTLTKLHSLFRRMMGATPKQQNINRRLRDIAEQRSLQRSPHVQAEINREFQAIQEHLRHFKSLNIFQNMNLSLGKFGSLVNGFSSNEADLDLTILTECYINQVHFLEILHGFLMARLNSSTYKVDIIKTAKVPSVKLTKKSPQGLSDIKIDLIVNNICGVINSKFLRMYAEMDENIKHLGILLKLWGKKKKIISESYMSSYSIIIMMINYLINQGYVPNLLEKYERSDMKPPTVHRVKQQMTEKFLLKNYFRTDLENQKKKVKRFGLFEAFQGFMKYYSPRDCKTPICLDDSQPEIDPEKIYTIKDPFDEPHNPGRVGIQYKDYIQSAFDDTLEDLKNGDLETILKYFKE